MTRLWSAAGAAAIALAFGITSGAAQAPQTPQTPEQPSASADKPITISGCVKKSTDGKSFFLLKSKAGSGAVGTSGSSASAEAATAYRLIAGMGQNLDQHVGHKVEITGTADTMGTVGTSGSEASEPWAKNAKPLKVSLVKHVSDTCE